MRPFLVLLDRDGTLIEEKEYLADPDGVVLLPGVVEGLRQLQKLGARFAVVSNQSGIGRGFYSLRDAQAVNARLAELLQQEGIPLEGIYLCPHGPDDGCACRKPGTALLQQAAKDAGLPLSEAILIGDKASDIEAGRRAGCRASILVRTGYGRETEARGCNADFVVDDLREVAEVFSH